MIRFRIRKSLCALSLVLAPLCGALAQNAPLNNESILQLLRWKATSTEIVGVISRNANEARFNLNRDEIASLLAAGVTQDVLEAMWKATTMGASGRADKVPAKASSPLTGQAATIQRAAFTSINAPTEGEASVKTSAADAVADTPAPQVEDPNLTAIKKNMDLSRQIRQALDAEDPDFSLVLGIGSLVTGPGVTDYASDGNIIRSSNLGRATPQLLAGLSLRSRIPNFRPFRQKDCDDIGKSSGTNNPVCELWRQRPWSGFVSLKFAPGSSQTLNGFVFGGTYAIARYLNGFIGFALTPVNEPAPGFRTTAAQFVKSEQAAGRLLNFDSNAMLNNVQNAFDGFSLTDPTGKLIFQGNPLTVHYRGGAVFGISIPIYFKSIFQ